MYEIKIIDEQENVYEEFVCGEFQRCKNDQNRWLMMDFFNEFHIKSYTIDLSKLNSVSINNFIVYKKGEDISVKIVDIPKKQGRLKRKIELIDFIRNEIKDIEDIKESMNMIIDDLNSIGTQFTGLIEDKL